MTDFKGFKGTAKPIEDIDLPRIAHQIGCGEDEMHAFMEAETRGSGFDDQGRPRILFERHKFYLYCPKAKLSAAVKAGLANKTAGGYGKESEQYGKLQKAIAIDEHSALMSCSWGLAQVMGFNHKLAGYDTVEAMILDFMSDEETHLQAAVAFIKNSGLDDELRRHDWKGFAKGYNGSGYAVNKYDEKLAAAFAKWAKIKDTPWTPDGDSEVDLSDGKVHPELKNVQQRLDELGYPEVGSVDGKWGSKTAAAILAFRNDNGLPTDAKIDAALLTALMTAKPREIAPARANATVADLRKEDAPEIKQTDQTKVGGYAAVGLGAFTGAQQALGSMKDTSSTVRAIWDTLEPLQHLITDNLWLILGAGGAFFVWKSGILQNIRLFKHQSGQDVSA
jgi:hypothetical protein